MLLGVALVASTCSRAQTFSIPPPVPYIGSSSGVMLNNLGILNMSQQIAARSSTAFSGSAARETAGNTSIAADAGVRGQSVASKLAAQYPIATHSQAEGLFTNLLTSFHQVESRFGIPPNDVAGAVAAFLAGSYMAYRNIDFPDSDFNPLVAQMREVLAVNAQFVRADSASKREMYEQLAILGMFMASTQMALKDHPNPGMTASLRRAAKGYLEQFLKVDADKVRITSQGLVIR
jgi:hypothetical protein